MTETCCHCNKEFTPSFRAGRNTGRARTYRDFAKRSQVAARFCSLACRQAAYYQRRKERFSTAEGAILPARTENASLSPANGRAAPPSGVRANPVSPPSTPDSAEAAR
jgi:hypothetical protein